MATATRFLDGNAYKGFYIVSAKKCPQTDSQKGFSIFKLENGSPVWEELDSNIMNMNLAKARVDVLSALLDVPTEAPQEPQEEPKGTIDSYLFSFIPKKHKDSIKAIYKDGKIYTAVLTNGTTVTNITNWDSFKRAIRRAIEG